MVEFGVSRLVIRNVLDALRDEGLIRRLQGSGTFSTAAKVIHDFGYLHGPHDQDAGFEHTILNIETTVAPTRVAERLRLDTGANCGIAEVLATLDGEPFYLTTLYVPETLVPIVRLGESTSDWYGLYERAGIRFGTTDHMLEAVVADPGIAETLEVEPGSPLMLLERTVRDRSGRPIEYAFTWARGDRVAMVQHLARPTQPSFLRLRGETP